MAKQVDTFSGNKTKVTIAKIDTFVIKADAYPKEAVAYPTADVKVDDVFMASADIIRVKGTTGKPTLKKGQFAKCIDATSGKEVWERIDSSIVLKVDLTPIAGLPGRAYPPIALGEFAYNYKGMWYNPFDMSTFREQTIFLTETDAASVYRLEFQAPSVTSASLSTTMAVDSYSVMGEEFNRKAKTIKDGKGSLNCKLTFGVNPAQKLMYQNLFDDSNCIVSVYHYAYLEDGEIDLAKSTVQWGEAIITSFDCASDPTKATDVTINFEIDGAVHFKDGTELINLEY